MEIESPKYQIKKSFRDILKLSTLPAWWIGLVDRLALGIRHENVPTDTDRRSP